MITGNLLDGIKINHLTTDGTNYQLAAGTTDVESGYVDMAGYDGCLFIITLGDCTNGGEIALAVEGCATYNGTYAALTGASYSATVGATDHDYKVVAFDVRSPVLRYLHIDTNRGTQNTVIEDIVAIQYNPKEFPITQAVTAGQLAVAAAAVCVQAV